MEGVSLKNSFFFGRAQVQFLPWACFFILSTSFIIVNCKLKIQWFTIYMHFKDPTFKELEIPGSEKKYINMYSKTAF